MRCLFCSNISFYSICSDCLEKFKNITPRKRVLENGLVVYSFYAYSDISLFLHVKHLFHGNGVLKRVAKVSFTSFAKELDFPFPVNVIPIDDHVRNAYSHTAIFAKAMKYKNITPLFSTLRATSNVSYSGKSLKYRKANPREFTCKLKKESNIILVDDLITTGSTLLEASTFLQKQGHTVLFALTLADAKEI